MEKLRTVEMPPPLPRRHFYSATATDFADIPTIIHPTSEHFALLLAVDSRDISTSVVGEVSKHLILAGVVYVCVWGQDCERVHDIFDETQVEMELDQGWIGHVMTTWHSKEPLQDAICFFENFALP